MNKLKEIFGNYRICGVPSRDDGYEVLVEGMEENIYAVQYQLVILESRGRKTCFELKTLFYKDGYEAFGPDSFFFHSHQFVMQEEDTDVNNLIATAYTNHRFDSKMY